MRSRYWRYRRSRITAVVIGKINLVILCLELRIIGGDWCGEDLKQKWCLELRITGGDCSGQDLKQLAEMSDSSFSKCVGGFSNMDFSIWIIIPWLWIIEHRGRNLICRILTELNYWNHGRNLICRILTELNCWNHGEFSSWLICRILTELNCWNYEN
jgi:hypothetical protein